MEFGSRGLGVDRFLVLGRVLQLAAAVRGNGEQVTKGAAGKSARARALEEEKIKLQIRAADGSSR